MRDFITFQHGDVEFVVTVDNSGSIGNKTYDSLCVPYDVVAYYSTRTALMENYSANAKPIAVNVMNFCGDDSWNLIVEGVEKALLECGLDIKVNGSTESNFEMVQSALGISVIGVKTQRVDSNGDCFAVVGKPLVGQEVIDEGGQVISLSEFVNLINLGLVCETIPVGSKGIGYEMKQLNMTGTVSLDMMKSSGPSTCVVISYRKENENKIKSLVGDKFYPISIDR